MATRKKPNAETEAYARLLLRIAELERKVALLEAQPREQHTHYHTAPYPYVVPAQPQSPGWTRPIIYGTGADNATYSSDVVGGTAPPYVKVGTAA